MQIIDYGYHLSVECKRDSDFELDLKRISKTAHWDRELGTYIVNKNVKKKVVNLAKSYFDHVEIL